MTLWVENPKITTPLPILVSNYSAYPHPKSLSLGRGTSIRLPFSHWEKGLGDEGSSTWEHLTLATLTLNPSPK